MIVMFEGRGEHADTPDSSKEHDMRNAVWMGSMVALTAAACGSSHSSDGAQDGGVDMFATDMSVAADLGDRDARAAFDGGSDMGPLPTICGGSECSEGQECCFLTGDCFDPAVPDACAAPDDPDVCHSNRDCPVGTYCRSSSDRCVGPGRCEEPPPTCGTRAPVCGCDGFTYDNGCEAARNGVRVSGIGLTTECGERTSTEVIACGDGAPGCPPGWECDPEVGQCFVGNPLIACGVDENCPSGLSCCASSGTCFDAVTCPTCCAELPAGTLAPCTEDVDCLALHEEAFCYGRGCDGAGGCSLTNETCGGEEIPVCGCDGTTYTNDCWARRAAVRVDTDGMCGE